MNYITTSYSLPVAAICISIPLDTYLLRVGDTVVRMGLQPTLPYMVVTAPNLERYLKVKAAHKHSMNMAKPEARVAKKSPSELVSPQISGLN